MLQLTVSLGPGRSRARGCGWALACTGSSCTRGQQISERGLRQQVRPRTPHHWQGDRLPCLGKTQLMRPSWRRMVLRLAQQHCTAASYVTPTWRLRLQLMLCPHLSLSTSRSTGTVQLYPARTCGAGMPDVISLRTIEQLSRHSRTSQASQLLTSKAIVRGSQEPNDLRLWACPHN